MIRWLLTLAAGLALGGIVHILTILAMPQLAQNDAYARLARFGKVNEMFQIPEPTPFEAPLPSMDPSLASAACLYDLSRGPLSITVPTTPDMTSVAFYTRQGRVFYSLNDRAAGLRNIDLQLMTPQQRALLPQNEEITAADRLIIESPSTEGMVFIRALVREEGARATIRALLQKAGCRQVAAR